MFDNATSVTIDLPPRPLHQLSTKPGTTGSYSFAMSGVYIRPTSIERDATRQCIVCATVCTSGAIMFAPVIEGDESNINDRRKHKESGKTPGGENKSIGSIVPAGLLQKSDRKRNPLQLSNGVARAYRNGVSQEAECLDATFPPLAEAMQAASPMTHKHITFKISELVRVAEFLGAERVTIIVGEPNNQAKVVGWSQFDNIEQSVSGIGVVCPISIEDATPIDVYNHNLDYARKAWDNP
jgi:ferredoxin